MAAYYPYRAFKTRPYFKEFLSLPDAERSWDHLVQMALSRVRRAFGEDTKGNPRVHTCAINESWLSTSVAEFFSAGQAVFHISPALREAFLHSDLGDATAADLRFPFNDLYVHLGTDLGLTFNDGATRLEGAFLHRMEDRKGQCNVRITLVGVIVFFVQIDTVSPQA